LERSIMEKDEIKYSLLEIMEGPKRINSVSHTLVFDYLLEAAQEQDRFEAFMRVLLRNAWWAYYGICIMASDIIPSDTLLAEERNSLTDLKYRHGSINELTILNMFISYFERGLFAEKKHRTYFVRYIAETLSKDEYEFVLACVYKKHADKVLPMLKKMYENGHLAKEVHHFFSFAMNHEHDRKLEFTKTCLPVKKLKMYWKIGEMFFDGKKILDRRKSDIILDFIKKTSQPSVNFAGISYPLICEVWVEGDLPVMIVTTERAFILKRPEIFDDKRFIELFNAGYKNFLCVRGSRVVSYICEENGFLKFHNVTVKKFKNVRLPLLILGMDVNIADFIDAGGNEVIALAPNGISIPAGTKVKYAEFCGANYIISEDIDNGSEQEGIQGVQA